MKLNWVTTPFSCRDAVLGDFDGGDGVRFNLVHYPTCYRRGPWRLLIEVEDRNRTWGCFDDQDMPVRYYHSEQRALEEAQAIADVLISDHAKKTKHQEKNS
jgi:hypothetical protein